MKQVHTSKTGVQCMLNAPGSEDHGSVSGAVVADRHGFDSDLLISDCRHAITLHFTVSAYGDMSAVGGHAASLAKADRLVASVTHIRDLIAAQGEHCAEVDAKRAAAKAAADG